MSFEPFKHILIGILQSIIQVGRYVVFGKRPDVVFYYPQLFNRSADGTNPYFAPLIRICEKHGLKYILIEESATGYQTDLRSIKADAIFWLIWLIRKILIKGRHYSQQKADRSAARIIDAITFHKFRAETYITISNSMIDILGDINPRGRVYDYQHGIIYRGHAGYFSNNDRLRESFYIPNRRVLLWGELYKRNLTNLPGGINPDDKFIVVGYPLYQRIEIEDNIREPIILVSLQFTSDISSEVSAGMIDMLDEFASKATRHGYKLLLKHHPRFVNEVDLGPLLDKYSGHIELTSAPLAELAKKAKLHVTWGSTTALEYAAYGVPTYFLRDNRFDWATEIFYGQYSYPLYDGMIADDILGRINDREMFGQDCKTVKEWYESAYSPLNEDLLLKIFKGEKYEK